MTAARTTLGPHIALRYQAAPLHGLQGDHDELHTMIEKHGRQIDN